MEAEEQLMQRLYHNQQESNNNNLYYNTDSEDAKHGAEEDHPTPIAETPSLSSLSPPIAIETQPSSPSLLHKILPVQPDAALPSPFPASPYPALATELTLPMKYVPVSQLYSPKRPPLPLLLPPPLPPPPPPSPPPPPPLPPPPRPSAPFSSSPRYYSRRRIPAQLLLTAHDSALQQQQKSYGHRENHDDDDEVEHPQYGNDDGDGLQREGVLGFPVPEQKVSRRRRPQKLADERNEKRGTDRDDQHSLRKNPPRAQQSPGRSPTDAILIYRSSDDIEEEKEKQEGEKEERGKQRPFRNRAKKKKTKKDQMAVRIRGGISNSEKGSPQRRLPDGNGRVGSSRIVENEEDCAEASFGYTSDDLRLHKKSRKMDALLPDMEACNTKLHTQAMEAGRTPPDSASAQAIEQEGEEEASDRRELLGPNQQEYVANQEDEEDKKLDHVENNQRAFIPAPEKQDAGHGFHAASQQDIGFKEEEAFNHSVELELKLDVTLFADEMMSLSAVRGGDPIAQQTELGTQQDSVSAEFKDSKCEVVITQDVEEKTPVVPTQVVGESRLEDGCAEEHDVIKLGEIKHFYRRRHRRSKGSSAAAEVGVVSTEVGDQKILSANKTPDWTPAITLVDTKEQSLELAESDLRLNSQINRTTSPTKNSLRWSRELMNLVSNGYLISEESTESLDGIDSSSCTFPARKKRKLQRINDIPKGTSRSPLAIGLVTQSERFLHKQAQQKWREINLGSTDPTLLIRCKCKVYWPDDKIWYTGVINKYDTQAGTHHVDYDDGDQEDLFLAKELVKLYISQEEMIARNLLSDCRTEELKRLAYEEMTALATVLEDFQEEFGHGELVWAKIKGHPMWPAFVMDEDHASACGLDAPVCESSLPVQFFGSYDYARISSKQAVSFSKGLFRKLYSKCKKVTFDQGLKEAERYMKEGKLPDMMSKLQNEVFDSTQNPTHMETSEEDEDFMGDERTHKTKKSVQSLLTCPIKLGNLQVLSLGKIVRDSEYFHSEHHIWTEGYTAVRKFPSIKDPERLVDYKMEVMKDPLDRTRPLFCITSYDGELVEGSTPSMCWRKIYQKLDSVKDKSGAMGLQPEKKRHQVNAGDFMFGFTNPQISKLIQALPNARVCFKFTGWFDKKATDYLEQLLPAGYKPVEVDWKHADRCSVCDLDEEYTNNLFLQCDRCRILVHMHCYGESEPPNGHLWLCQLCRPEAPAKNPLCCLCPVQGGAMKRTIDGRWAHVTCAMWIPETCFVDVKLMEPIDGLRTINKERWKLTCIICKVPYGVCIQCSEPSCYIAYHVLCARSSGFVLEVLEDSSHKHNGKVDDFDQPVRLLSYCRRHRQPKLDRDTVAEQVSSSKQELGDCFNYCLPGNSSGCARTEPYNGATRRGRQEPEVRAAASAKRLYVEKMPYRVSGFCRQDQIGSDTARKFTLFSLQARNLQKRKSSPSEGDFKALTAKGNLSDTIGIAVEESLNILSVSDRYQQMCFSLKQRLTFGKSAIHGWGVFTKQSHRAGDMVIEYAGETVRPIVADLRERLIYNTLVGAGTYMFRIDDEHVVDATREGSIAHLINHSCEPNCFSRVVTVSGEDHIIIFAKRDIEEGEELSYDYRFTSKGEQLECFCGFPSCRGFVNVDDADEEPTRILVPSSEITAWIPSTS